MKKTHDYSKLAVSELQAKQQEYIKDLVTSRISMDLTDIKSATNIQNLLRVLKTTRRFLAAKQKSSFERVIKNDNG